MSEQEYNGPVFVCSPHKTNGVDGCLGGQFCIACDLEVYTIPLVRKFVEYNKGTKFICVHCACLDSNFDSIKPHFDPDMMEEMSFALNIPMWEVQMQLESAVENVKAEFSVRRLIARCLKWKFGQYEYK
jgi:hypothetical protein